MNEMSIEYEAEDTNGVAYRMEGVYPVFYTDSKTPRLFLLTEEAESFTVSLYFNGEMDTFVYPIRAKKIIERSLQSCNGRKALTELAKLNGARAGRNQVN